MRLQKLFFLFIILIIIVLPLVNAKSGHISLLTVTSSNHTEGGIANVYLEVKPGTGRIFIDSFPLTKLDTQISTRFANEIACDFLDEDCSRYDFFYTIRAKATIVGGPSAGAAMTVLTISVLSDLNLDENTIMTGTINSGNLIGPVAGINEKINAAVKNGFTKIIIPKWQSTINITEIKENGLEEKITIVKVKNLEETLYHFTGKDFSKKNYELAISKEYIDLMKETSEILCNRTQIIIGELEPSNGSIYISAERFWNRSFEANAVRDYYARASYCFSANLRLRELQFENKNQEELSEIHSTILEELESIENYVNNVELETLSDLETYMIVKERISEAKGYLEKVDSQNISSTQIAYAKERLYSAIVWVNFFSLGGEPIQLEESHLRDACIKKAAEAEERINYARLYVPGLVEQSEKNIQDAMNNYDEGEFALCIFKASKAKAEANILLTALTTSEEDIENVLEEKLDAIKNIIIEQDSKNMFPILGYSYYEYSKSLTEHDIISSVNFAEYALELSKLDMYFPNEKKFSFNINFDVVQTFVIGIMTGILLILLITFQRKKKR
ncbi:MAG: S16 family serine protease [archaeon]